MASVNFAAILHKNTPKIIHILIYTPVEWITISLLFLNGLLSNLITEFVSLIGLLFAHDNHIHLKNYSSELINPNLVRLVCEERLVPVELIDEITLRDCSMWCNKEKHLKREAIQESSFESLQGLDKKTNGEISIGSRICEQDQEYEINNKTNHDDSNTNSYHSLFEIASIKTEPLVTNELNPNSNLLDGKISCNQDQHTNSYHSLFGIMPIEATPLLKPNTRFESSASSIVNEFGEAKTKISSSISTWFDTSISEGNKEQMDSEILNRLDELLNRFEEEKVSVQEKLEELERKKGDQETEIVIKDIKPILEEDSYESLADFLNCEMNYSSNDLVSLGNQRPGLNHTTSFRKKKSLGRSFSLRTFDSHILEENEKMDIEDEFGDLRSRLRDIEMDRELIEQCVRSLEKGDVKMIDAIQEILMQNR